MNNDLMMAVLAMDAYKPSQNIGLASRIRSEASLSGFAATAYSYNGETIISYRGTDTGTVSDLAADILFGWPGGGGGLTSQSQQAVTFAQTVASTLGVNPSTVTYTGHSLGGGLAGLVAGLYGREAVMFDNMAFRLALSNLHDYASDPLSPYHAYVNSTYYSGLVPWPPNTSQISGYRLDGQILNFPFGFQSEGAVVGSGVNWSAGPIDAHSQALLVLNMYADQTSDLDGVWKDAAQYLGQPLIDLQGDGIIKIAYSVVSEGERPNGDAAAHSLFDDAADVANFINGDGEVPFNINWGKNLGEIVVGFAHRQAVNVVTGADKGSGVFHATDAGLYLSLDSTFNAWGDNPSIQGWNSLKAGLTDHLAAGSGEVLSSEALAILNAVDFALFSAGGTVDLDLQSSNPMLVAGQIENPITAAGLVFGTDDVDVIKGGKGDDFLIGGGGADTLIGGEGKDALFGGSGSDLLMQGTLEDKPAGSGSVGPEEVLEGGVDEDYIVLTDADTDHVTIRDGDTKDRLLLMPHLANKTTAGDGSLPLTALVGGVADTHGVYWYDYDGEVLFRAEPATNINVDDDGRKWKGYGYRSEDESFGVGYQWYFQESLLEITVDYADGSKQFKITIENFNNGDYGLSLTVHHVSDDFNYDDNPASGRVYYAAAQAALDSKLSQLRKDADKYTLTKDFELQQQSRMFAAFTAASEEPTVLDAANLVMRIDGDASNDTLDGIGLREKLFGHNGDDRLDAGGGDDVLEGGSGHDRLIGGTGADLLDGGAGVDTADYRTSDAAVQVDLAAQYGTGGDAEGDTLVLIENLAGSHFGDVLTGDDMVNRLQGYDGADHLLGGGGNDRLLGGLGADVIDGGSGVDTADYSTSLAGVIVNLKLNNGQGSDAEGDSFIAVENLSGSDFNDALTGDDLNNRLTGVDGDDTLSGLGGIDYLVGGNGNDVMTGGAGADVFVFNLGSGLDTIIDFWAGTGRTDRIQFVDGQLGNFAGIVAQAADTAAGVVIAINAEDSLTLSGVQISQLHPGVSGILCTGPVSF